MTIVGRVRWWHAAEGWGVIDSVVTPGGCWVHFSAVLVAGYRVLEQGQQVRFTFETAEQDGYSFRAVEVWPAGQTPVRPGQQPSGPSPAYDSTLSISYDADDDDDDEGED